MKTYKFLAAVALLFISVSLAHASVIPSLSLSNVNAGSSQITVYGDPNSTIQLHYGDSASTVATIGSTDDNGNFTTILSTSSYGISSCNQTAYVVVDGVQSQTIQWSQFNTGSCTTSSGGNPSFSQNNIVLNVGQSQAVTISGTGGYSISNNSNPSVISANINANTLNLYATTFGGSTITVCESDGACATVSVVAVTTSTGQTVNNQFPTLSSFTVSSNDANGRFMNGGDILTILFTTNESVDNVSVSIAGVQRGVSGSGTGPYTVSYTMTGSESLPIPVVINFSDLSGNSAQAAFALGNITTTVAPTPVTTPVIPVGCTSLTAFSPITGASCAGVYVPTSVTTTTTVTTPATTGYVFTEFLSLDSQDNEVTQLQHRLTTLGFYTGPITGYFGPLTEQAVIALQAAHGITQAGYVGPATRAVLNQY